MGNSFEVWKDDLEEWKPDKENRSRPYLTAPKQKKEAENSERRSASSGL